MEKVFCGGYELFIFRETQNSASQAVISLVVLWEKAKLDMTPRSPFQLKLLCNYICMQY